MLPVFGTVYAYGLASSNLIGSALMDNSAYIALSRQLTLFKDMSVTANNLANANTTGFNAEHIMFDSYLTKDNNSGDRNKMAFANDVSTYRDTRTGAMNVTGNDLDVAIQGNGYFSVQTPLGTRYTRAGNFHMDATGAVITADGYGLLDNGGQPIVLPENTKSVVIGEGGNMKVNGEDFATIGVSRFDNEQVLERLNGKLFKTDATPQPATDARVVQGMLENSNVQPVVELTHMIDVSRSVENTSKFIEAIYELERKAATTYAQQG